MKLTKMALALVMVLFGTMVTGSALAYGRHYGGPYHGHVRFGVFIGAPAFWYYPPPYYYPPVAAVPSTPPVYIEQGEAQAAAPAPEQSPAYWYYCADEKAYYPYVKQCPGGWQRVSPQPPPG